MADKKNLDCFGAFLDAMNAKNIQPDLDHLRTAFNAMTLKERVAAFAQVEQLAKDLARDIFKP